MEELKSISKYLMENNKLHTWTMFVLSHCCLLRGESLRRMELADMFVLGLENEGII